MQRLFTKGFVGELRSYQAEALSWLGFLDAVETKDVVRYEAALLSFLRSEKADILKTIRETKALDDDTAKALKDALTEFGKTFA